MLLNNGPISLMDIKNTSSFSFLAEHDPLFVELASGAERVFSSDPNTTLIKLRQLGEALAQHIAVLIGVEFDEKINQADLLYRLNRELKFEPVVRELFHTLRIEGNKATHQFRTKHREALDGLKVARALAIWFHQSFGKQGSSFKPGPFTLPQDPSSQLRQLQSEIEILRTDLTNANVELDSSKQLNDLIQQEKVEFEALALAMDEESQQLAELAKEHELALTEQKKEYESKLHALQKKLEQQDEKAS
ncbi:DUF4145 domain-containing protein, partial [Vibrio harveyi]|uniref:DUF4145 domain-containing protein n=1 Tax=Vibrio harveyi TaxID=669 RepID=UPI001E58F811